MDLARVIDEYDAATRDFLFEARQVGAQCLDCHVPGGWSRCDALGYRELPPGT